MMLINNLGLLKVKEQELDDNDDNFNNNYNLNHFNNNINN